VDSDEIALVQEVADRIWAALEHRKAEPSCARTESGWRFFSG
jgi:GAF domain-containing protein